MECKICGSKEIKGDCQYINGDYYHNHCIEQLEQENKDLHNKIEKAIEYIENNIYSSVSNMKTTLYLQNDELYDLLKILKDSNVNE